MGCQKMHHGCEGSQWTNHQLWDLIEFIIRAKMFLDICEKNQAKPLQAFSFRGNV